MRPLSLLFSLFMLCMASLNVQAIPTDYSDYLGGCPTPTGLIATPSGTTATLSWNAVPGALGYWVEVENEGTTPFFHIEVLVTTNTYSVDGLVANGNYKFKTRTNCGNDKSDWSNWTNFTGAGTGTGGGGNTGTCAAPTGLVATTTGTSASLTWTAVAGAVGYSVEVENEGLTPFFHIEVPVGTNTYTVTGLVANGNYKFKVRTNCGSNNSDWSGWTTFNNSGSGTGSGSGGSNSACSVPGSLSVQATNGTSAQINWNAVSGAVGYRLEIENGPGNPIFFRDTVVVTTNTYTVQNLTPMRNYKVKVRTLCAGGQQSIWSNWFLFNSSTGTLFGGSGQACGKPTGLNATSITANTARLSWAKVPGAIYYSIQLEKESGSGGTPNITATSTDTTIVMNNLLPGSLYKFKVRTQCANGRSKWSNWKFFTTPPSLNEADDRSTFYVPATLQLNSYPNPVTDVMTVQLSGVDTRYPNQLSITDLMGRTVAEYQLSTAVEVVEQSLDMSSFRNGIYLLHWVNGNQRITRKIIVNK